MWYLSAQEYLFQRIKLAAHIKAGAKKVIISAPGKEVDNTVVFGVNHETLTDMIIPLYPMHHVPLTV